MKDEYKRFLMSELLFNHYELKFFTYPMVFAEYVKDIGSYEFRIERLNTLSSIMRYKMKNIDVSEEKIKEIFKEDLERIRRNETIVEDSKDYLEIDKNFREHLFFLADNFNPYTFFLDENEKNLYDGILDSYRNLNYTHITEYVEIAKNSERIREERFPTDDEIENIKKEIKIDFESCSDLKYSKKKTHELQDILLKYEKTYSELEEEYNIKVSKK